MYRIVEQNLRAAMRSYSLIGNGSEARDYPGVTIASSGLDLPVFNSAMLSAATENLDPMIATADTHFRARGLGWTFWICDDLVSRDLREWAMRVMFRAKNMSRIASPPGMYADKIAPRKRREAPLTFSRVGDDEQTRIDFAHVAAIVFSLPFKTSRNIYGSAGLWQTPSYGWVGYFERKPVSIVSVVIAADAIGVYSLGTLPQHQGCGFGETMLRHALEQAQYDTGIHRSVLQSTTQGFNLYLRLGYRVVTNFSIYMREGCAPF
jgi:ribosomal protein S18 acetylase RimI-like enzyme